MKNKIIITCLYFLIPFITFSQTINGIVVDERREAIPFISVVLLHSADSSFITGCITNEEGGFYFDTDTINKMIVVSGIGYKNKQVTATQNKMCIRDSLYTYKYLHVHITY